MRRFVNCVLAGLLLAPTAFGADAGSVKGTFSIGGKVFTPDHVYAMTVPSTHDKTKDDVRVVVSVGPQPEERLIARGSGFATSLSVTIGPNMFDPEIGLQYANSSHPVDLGGGQTMNDMGSWSGIPGVTFVKKEFRPGTNGRVAGKLTIPPNPKDSNNPIRQESALTADLEFDTPILGRVPQ